MLGAVPVRSYARRAPLRGAPDVFVPIRVSWMNWADSFWWDARVQPALVRRADRADRVWSWAFIRQVLPIWQHRKGRRCLALVTWVRNRDGDGVRAAMHLFIEHYPHLDTRVTKEASFAWFISTAPAEVLAQFGVTKSPALGRVCIDAAIVASMVSGDDGRIGLHCAQAGGTRLMLFYEQKCRLLRLPPSAELPVGRHNDGRFFYTDEQRAEELAAEMDPLREALESDAQDARLG